LPSYSPDSLSFGWLVQGPGMPASDTTFLYLNAPFTPDAFGSLTSNQYAIKSYGADNLDDSTYTAGATPPPFAADQTLGLGPDDYLVRVGNWSVTVYCTFSGSPTPSSPTPTVRLRLYFPATGVPATSAPSVTTALTYVQSAAVPLSSVSVNATTYQGATFSGFAFPPGFMTASLTGDQVRAPIGPRSLALFYEAGTTLPYGSAVGNVDPAGTPAFSTQLQPQATSASPLTDHWVAQIPVLLSPRGTLPSGPFFVTLGPQ
jgi:hypothetical protein